ncbi:MULTISPECIES: RDD family protein [Clostridium]|uniref:RDD family protein n=1 Tax=Clostridium TaxID=1485 RepID=UPI0008250CC4|nr:MULTISPECIES: RDD family protein [Clostridium]PJI10214.1 hypothetical protein CUB90_21085 [Clostridium sp. CT7]
MKNKTISINKTTGFASRRIFCTVLDLIVWYLVYIIILLPAYFMQNGMPQKALNPYIYKNRFDVIIKSPTFLILYLGFIILWEMLIPVITNGQSLFKKKFNLKIECDGNGSYINFVVRGLVKIIILNPYGVIAYLISSSFKTGNGNLISDFFTILTIICGVLILMNKKTIHDKISKTHVVLIK